MPNSDWLWMRSISSCIAYQSVDTSIVADEFGAFLNGY